MYIGYVNKLRSNYGNLQHTVLMNLHKSYCLLILWLYIVEVLFQRLDKICKSWNVAIRIWLKLPYNAHTIYLGPLINQLQSNNQLYIRNFRFFYGMPLDQTTVLLKLV